MIADTFYDHGEDLTSARRTGGATNRRWRDQITQDEADALFAAGRLGEKPRTADEVNALERGDRQGSDLMFGHDAINRSILIETRAKRLGVWGMCPECNGEGHVNTEDDGHINLVIWMIHPRKSASRGVRINRLSKADASAARKWLAKAAKRNPDRFARVCRPTRTKR